MLAILENSLTKKNDQWIIVIVGFLLQITSLGFARFAYTVILPSMKDDLGFKHTQMGLLQTGIVTGYLVFAYLGGIFASKWSLVKTINFSVVITGLAMISLGLVSSFYLLLPLAFLVGAGSSGAYIPLVPLIVNWFSPKRRGLALGFVFSGAGVGIILVGYLVPFLLVRLGTLGWRGSWISLGGITVATALVSFFYLRERPRDMKKDSDAADYPQTSISIWRLLSWNHSVCSILVVYFLVGFGYIIYATFFVTYAMEEISVTKAEAGFMWSIFGVFSIVGCVLWGTISDFLGRKFTTIWDIMILSTSIFISVLWATRIGLYVSIVLFAFAFNGFITLIATMFGDQAGITMLAKVFGLSTLIHGLGQAIGVSLAGYLKDLTSTFQVPFLLSGGIIGFSLFIFILFYDRKKRTKVL
jgi:MFS family permease